LFSAAKNTVSLLILGQEQMIYVLIAQHGATWRGTAQLHHGAEYAASGIVQTGILTATDAAIREIKVLMETTSQTQAKKPTTVARSKD
jgi:hypothetical protein